MRGQKKEIAPGVWRLRVYVGRNANGSPVFRSKTLRMAAKGDKAPKAGAGTRLADAELAKMVAEVARGNRATGTETVGDLLERFCDHAEAIGRSPTTVREYRRIVGTVLVPELGNIKLTGLSAAQLDALYAKLRAAGNKPLTVRHVHSLIGAALAQAERWDLVDRNIARRATPPPVHAEQVTAPSPNEVHAILKAAEEIDPGLAALLLLAALTGARRGELCALRWTDVDLEGRTLTIARSVYEIQGGGWGEKATKTHQVRTIGLDDLALTVLGRQRAAVDELAASLGLEPLSDGFVFSRSPVGAEPIRPAVVSRFAKRAAEVAGVDSHLHALRHFSASQAIAAGFDPVTVAGRLGHRDSSVTLRVYSHVLEQRDRELAASLGKTLALPATETPQ